MGLKRVPPTSAPIRLRPVSDQDLGPLYRIASERPEEWARVCHRGVPSPAQFGDRLWAGVLAQFIIELSDGVYEPVGLVSLHSADFANRTAWLELVSFGPGNQDGAYASGLLLLTRYAARSWDFRKLYFETLEFQGSPLIGVPGVEKEAHFREFYYHDGRYWDRMIWAIDNSKFEPESLIS